MFGLDSLLVVLVCYGLGFVVGGFGFMILLMRVC